PGRQPVGPTARRAAEPLSARRSGPRPVEIAGDRRDSRPRTLPDRHPRTARGTLTAAPATGLRPTAAPKTGSEFNRRDGGPFSTGLDTCFSGAPEFFRWGSRSGG